MKQVHPIFRTIIGGFIDGQAKALDRSEHAERVARLFDDTTPKLKRGEASSGIPMADRLSRSSEWQGECRVWLRGTNGHGYGRLTEDGRQQVAHRLSYECFVGPVPEGLELDHLCRNRACINPFHLEPVTSRENMLRGVGPTALHAAKTHCHQGHPFSEENLIIKPDGSRCCRTCKRERERDWRNDNPEKVREMRNRHARRMLRHQEAEAERRRIVDEAVTLAFDDDAVLPNPL